MYEIQDIHFYDNKAQLFYSGKEEHGRKRFECCAFVTRFGRMHLYEELFKIDDRFLYFDTDSIIFISKDNLYEPQLADYLGKFTNEIKNDNFIQEFVSAGPKNYGYLMDNGKSVENKGIFC